MRRIATALLASFIVVLVAGELVIAFTAPAPLDDRDIPAHTPDLANGEMLFNAGGCLSCHKVVEGSGIEPGLPAGGRPLASPVGTFYASNITPDRETGIGRWSDAQFVNAMTRGVSPELRHYFPAFPYTSFRHMSVSDLLDLKAYLFSLAPIANEAPEATIPFAGFARKLMGPWKLLAFGEVAMPQDPAKGEAWNRGAYLVQGPGHCGECHTPRNLAMASKSGDAFLAGGPHPEGKGKVPSLRGLLERKRFKDAGDLATALAFGETYGYEDISSGGMGEVQTNLGKLPEAELTAIATFLTSIQQ